MAVQFIFGASGTGKTTKLYQEMIAKSQGGAPVLFLLPEQSNMAAEKEMVQIHPNGGTMDISILSFTRLAFKVFDELNIHTEDLLDDYGKSILLMKLLKEHAGELRYYGSMVGKQGFVDEMKSMISEFYQYQVDGERLQQAIDRLSPEKSLYHKLSDLKILFTAFENAIRGSYLVAEQLLSLLKEVAPESHLLQGAQIYFDDFTGFTPVQYGVIEQLMCLSCDLYFSINMDAELFGKNEYSEHGLFYLSKQTVDRLCKLAQDHQTVILPHVSLDKNIRQEGCEDLIHLERQIFRFPVVSYEAEPENIRILAAQQAVEETQGIAQMIQDLVKNKGYHYEDFAVITGNLQEESEVWRQAMDMYEVPYFLDYSEPMSHNPMVEVLSALLEVFRLDFSYESVFALLKTGYFGIEPSRIYALENYVIQYGVKGYAWWSKSFRGNYKGLHKINETRGQVMELFAPYVERFQKKKAVTKEYLQAVYDFMSTNKMAEQLYEKSIAFEEEGLFREAKAYGQVYDKFVEVLDRTMAILGEEEIERETFADVLKTGIYDMKLGIIPSTIDQVMIGDVERTRLHHVKILFVASLNEGIFPKLAVKNSILADRDRQLLKKMEIGLAPDRREEMFLQQFYFYMQITKPSEKLVLVYRKQDAIGAAVRPSYFVDRMQSVFPDSMVEEMDAVRSDILPVTRKALLADFTQQLVDGPLKDATLLYQMKRVYPDDFDHIMQGYLYHNDQSVLDQKLARALYGERMMHSVSRLETYSGCAYQFFLQYGLKLRKREEYGVETSHIGTILHAVMETFFSWVKEEQIDLQTLSEEKRNEKVEALTRAAAAIENETIFEESFRGRHQLDVFIRIAQRSIQNLCRHLLQGDMKPEYFEKKFGAEDHLSYIQMELFQGIEMELNGIVDRVDIKETEDAVYVKVIDYKSGAKDIDYLKMYEGRQLQLTVYMNVMLELLRKQYPDKRIIPTGMYYYHLYDPIIEEADEEKLLRKRIESSRLTGLVNEDETSRTLMDGKTGTVTPVRYKKDGELDSRNTTLVTEEELDQISAFVRNKMIGIGQDIISGKIPMNPEKGELSSPCNLCDFKSVCRFEPGLGGNAYQIAPQISKTDAKSRILQDGETKMQEKEGGRE